ncbi:MAG: OsmC family protein [Nitrososphaerota archaeon]|nr:OsmC family protein [Nitrososphaerota archaeon]MDG7023624.1 OsmC family protein [Nitrososphaerota archaeon]
MAGVTELEATVKEHVRKRHEEDDEEFLFGSERVDLRRVAHLKLEARKRKFKFTVDEPAERGGTDEGPNPLAYFIAGAASCLTNQYLTDAIFRGVKLEGLELTARGHFDRRMGGAFTEIVYDLRLTSRSPKAAILRLSREAEDMCYAHNTLKKAGVKMTTNLFLNGRPLG